MKTISRLVIHSGLLLGSLYLVTAPDAQAAPRLLLTTTSLQLAVEAGSTVTDSTILISNAGDGQIAPTVVSSAAWLQASVGASQSCPAPLTGLCSPLKVTANTASLNPGTYTQFLTVSSPGAVDSPQTIAVVLTVYGVPSNLSLYVAPNGGTASATFQTQGGIVPTVHSTTSSGGNWLNVSLQSAGSYQFYVPFQVKATSQPSQPVGSYTGSIAVSGASNAVDNKTIGVTLNVTSSPIISLNTPQLTFVLGQGSKATAPVTYTNSGQGSLAVTGASSTVSTGSGWLSATVSINPTGPNGVSVTADATSLAPGLYQGVVNLSTNAANTSANAVPVTLLVNSQTGPQLAVNGAVNIGDYAPILSPGDIAAAFGTQLATGNPAAATALPLPTNIGGVQVTVNGTLAPLFYVSSGQINFQVPFETAPGPAIIQVTNNGKVGNSISATITARAPRILTFAQAGTPPIIINYADGSIPTTLTTPLPSHPAHRGDTLVIYAVGLGLTTPAVASGVASPGTTLATVDPPVSVMLGGFFVPSVQVTPSFVGLTPGLASLYQINMLIPQDAPVGNSITLTLDVQGVPSHFVNIAIQ